jgi:lipopolysaccharide export system permease protein
VTIRRLFPPILGRYVCRQVLGAFVLTLSAFVAISLIAEFFDRFDTFLRHDASVWAMVRTFALQIPMVVTQVIPLAVLAAALVGLGLMARHREFIAMRACGVSLWQILTPLLTLAVLITAFTLFWNETIVPLSAKRWHHVWNREVKGKGNLSVFAGREVWYRGKAGFYNMNRVVLKRRTLVGLTVFQLGDGFTPARILTAERAVWTNAGWRFEGPTTEITDRDGIRIDAGFPEGFVLPETLEDFRVVAVEPQAFSYRMLRDQIRSLQAKGVDTSENWVDLYLKIALPTAAIIMMLLAVPLAVKSDRTASLSAAAGLGLAIGFAYFIVLAFARALGMNGALPPMVAAWASNLVFGVVGLYLVLGAE